MNPYTGEDFICPLCGKTVLKRWLEHDDTDGVYVIECPKCSAKGYGENYPDAYHNMQADMWLNCFSDVAEETISILKRIANSLEKISNKNNTQED